MKKMNFETGLSIIEDELSIVEMEKVQAGSPGQDVADCIVDAYTNHGWTSVWAWVQTAFIPETGVAIAIACAVYNV